MSVKRLKVIYTGGTLGMLPGPQGLVPAPGFANRLCQALPDNWLSNNRLQLDFLELDPPLDSSAMQPRHWFQLAALARQAEDSVQGIVILQGTDTLAWTASALHWLLPEISCPLLVTAAQKPLNTPSSDALSNIQQALLWASQPDLTGVYLNFHHQLFDPRYCRKQDAQAMDAFANPRGQALAHFRQPLPSITAPSFPQALNFQLTIQQLQYLSEHFQARILRLPLIPGLDASYLVKLTDSLDGLLLEGLGAGTSPPLREFYTALKKHKIVTGMLTQCWSGQVSHDYAASAEARQAGVVNLGASTPENAQASLTWLLALRQLKLASDRKTPLLWQEACM
ncbi:asparaginase [Marinospirillum sp.]|uniref:asparaginase n=1 Tax=Marinospirillum sp. TaxID=2183934 RepID=UPI00384E10B9